MPLASGAFGKVRWGRIGEKTKCVCKSATSSQPHADEYLEMEASMNAILSKAAPFSRHLAPWVGVCEVGGQKQLVWEACPGAQYPLSWYFDQPQPQLRELALDLGVIQREAGSGGGAGGSAKCLRATEEAALARKLLREMLQALVLFERAGVVHRDIKPANWLVDAHTHSLRLVDFGAACEARLIGGPEVRAVGSEIYMPPEQTPSMDAPYAFDVYSAAIVWLGTLVPALTSKRALDRFRSSVDYEYDHSVHEWLSHELAGRADGAPPSGLGEGSLALFEQGEEGRAAWRLLRAMMRADPRDRISASEALRGPYLGGCGASYHGGQAMRPESEPRGELKEVLDAPLDAPIDAPPLEECAVDFSCPLEGLPSLPEAADECELLHADEEVAMVAVRSAAHGLRFEDIPLSENAALPPGSPRVRIASVTDDHPTGQPRSDGDAGGTSLEEEVRAGDGVLALGALDVSELSAQRVQDLVDGWRSEWVQMRLLRL